MLESGRLAVADGRDDTLISTAVSGIVGRQFLPVLIDGMATSPGNLAKWQRCNSDFSGFSGRFGGDSVPSVAAEICFGSLLMLL